MIRKVLAVGALCVAGGGAWAMSGNDLQRTCTSEHDDFVEQTFCLGFISGVSEGIQSGLLAAWANLEKQSELEANEIKKGIWFQYGLCIPVDVTNDQKRDVVVQYLSQNPSERHAPASYLVHIALRGAFPCTK